MIGVHVRLDSEYWIMQDGDELTLVPAIIAQSGSKQLSIPGFFDPPPLAILAKGSTIFIELPNARRS